MNIIKQALGVLSLIIPYFMFQATLQGDVVYAIAPAAVAAIIAGGAILGGIAGKGAGRYEAPDKEDLVPPAYRFLTMPSAEGGMEFKGLAQDELKFLDKAIGMELFDLVEARGTAEIKRGFESEQDAAARAAFYGIGPQAVQAGSYLHSEAAAIADFQAQLQKLNVGFAFEGVDRLHFLEGQAQQAKQVEAGAEAQASAQPSSASQTISGLLAGASIGSSIAGGFGGGGKSPTQAASKPTE